MAPLDHGQFARALLDAEAAPPDALITWNGSDPSQRFAIYRNNVTVALVDALCCRFPVTQTLLGSKFFRAMARLYIQAHPPVSRLLHEYGDDLPAFVEFFPPARSVPYVPDWPAP